MKATLGTALAVAVLCCGQPANAQTKTHSESVTKKTGPGPNTKVKTEMVTGKVTSYTAGKEIEIEGPEGKNFDFDLDENARVEGTIAVGQMATVHFTKGDDGKEHVVVLAAGAAMKEGMPEAPGMSSGAKTEAKPPSESGRIYAESTTKRSGPGPNVKTKTEVVVGTVKEYEAGKKITVLGPKDKDYSFDLDEQATVKGLIVPGERVKVEFTKADDGSERVVILSKMSGKTSAKKKKKY